MEKGMIAYCIPTYNHPAVVQDILGKSADLYKEYGIDVYIYDSSEGSETRNNVMEFIKNGYDHIYYIRIEPSVSVDEKTVLILSGYGLKKQYDYLWPVKDRAYFGRNALRVIMAELEYEYNAIFLALSSYPWKTCNSNYSDTLYKNPVDFFYDWGWLATSLEATIFHYDSMLKNVDWQDFRDNYFINGRNAFDHFEALFIGLAKVEKPVVKVLQGEDIFSHQSMGVISSWISETFTIWANLWPKAVYALPACYNKYKHKVIKKTLMLPWLFGSYDKLNQLKQIGVLNREIFEDYRDDWQNLSDIPVNDVDLILDGNYDEVCKHIKIEIQKMILKKDYDRAFVLCWTNPKLKDYMGNCNYKILNNCFQINIAELDKNINFGIFNEISTLEEVIEKYRSMKYFLRKIEYGIREDMCYKYLFEHSEWFVSLEIALTIIVKECINKEKTIRGLEEYWLCLCER